MMVDLKGKVAVITGAAGGIGSCTAKKFAECGAIVYMTDINEDIGLGYAKEINDNGGEAHFIAADVMNEAQVRKVVEAAAARTGQIDILLNICGNNVELEHRGKIGDYKPEYFYKTVAMCMDGNYYFTRFCFPYMKEHGGRIVNTGSVTGMRMGLKFQSAYNVSKSAIHNLTRSQAIEYAQYGITVNCVIPGSTWHSRFRERLLKTPGMAEKFTTHIPSHEANNPDDQCAGYLFFCSPEAERMTGILMNIDNGWAAGYCRGKEHDIIPVK